MAHHGFDIHLYLWLTRQILRAYMHVYMHSCTLHSYCSPPLRRKPTSTCSYAVHNLLASWEYSSQRSRAAHTKRCQPLPAVVNPMATLSQAELQDYLQRIRVDKQSHELSPSLSTLGELQFAHVKHIPFENLALHHPKVSKLAHSTGSWLFYM